LVKKGNIPWNKGKKHSKETKEKISQANKGKKRSEEVKKQMSITHKNPSKETREKIRNANLGKNLSKETKKKISLANRGELNSFYGKKHSEETKEYLRSINLGKKASTETKKLLSDINSTPERKALQKEILKKSRKNMARPNIPEKAIGKILEEIGIKVKFLQDIDYKNLENKITSKEMDIVWKNSMGNKKIIEYNGRWHFDPREYQPDQMVEHHDRKKKAHEVWDEEISILNQIRKAGYEILIIWQKDWKEDHENEVKKIIEFATNV
jgi:hypothetical protein